MFHIHSKSNEFWERKRTSQTLYWNDLNKIRFLFLLSTSSFVLRTCSYPLALTKTRLQTRDKGGKSTFEMVKQIYSQQGIRSAFYRGYSVSICALIFEPIFIVTLEITRTFLHNNRPKSLSISQWDTFTSSASAGTAALLQQTFLVPIDVTTQRVMITRSSDGIRIIDVIRDIYFKSDGGIRAFYKGYLVTLASVLPFNSIIWTLYWKVQSKLEKFIPTKYDQIIAPLSSATAALSTSLLTQPIDILKTRFQVASKKQSFLKTFTILIQERGFKGLFSGSIPRACIVVPNSVIMMSLYEIIKRSSVQTHT